MSPLKITSLNQETHTDVGRKKIIHISLRIHARFQEWRSLTPSPPWSLVSVTVSQATFAVWCPSLFRFQRNRPQREFILLMQAFGSMKLEHQKIEIPAITVLMRSSLPANDRDLADQEEKRVFICWRRGSQLTRLSFFVQRGTP